MSQALVIAVGAATLVGWARVARDRSARRRSAAATVALAVTDEQVERRLADGRIESARWAVLDHVEVVCTPVRTADGATVFAMLAEARPDDGGAPRGCLVPLGVGYDEALLRQLTRLERFDLRAWSSALDRPAPQRTVVWSTR